MPKHNTGATPEQEPRPERVFIEDEQTFRPEESKEGMIWKGEFVEPKPIADPAKEREYFLDLVDSTDLIWNFFKKEALKSDDDTTTAMASITQDNLVEALKKFKNRKTFAAGKFEIGFRAWERAYFIATISIPHIVEIQRKADAKKEAAQKNPNIDLADDEEYIGWKSELANWQLQVIQANIGLSRMSVGEETGATQTLAMKRLWQKLDEFCQGPTEENHVFNMKNEDKTAKSLRTGVLRTTMVADLANHLGSYVYTPTPEQDLEGFDLYIKPINRDKEKGVVVAQVKGEVRTRTEVRSDIVTEENIGNDSERQKLLHNSQKCGRVWNAPITPVWVKVLENLNNTPKNQIGVNMFTGAIDRSDLDRLVNSPLGQAIVANQKEEEQVT